MAGDEGEAWRLPGAVGGGDARGRSQGPREGAALPVGARERLRRIVSGAPEAVVKVTGRVRGGAAGLRAHLDYVTRGGKLPAERDDGARLDGRAALGMLAEDWALANAAGARSPRGAEAVAVALSMPPGSPPGRVEAAARAWARAAFGGTHDWVMARHDDRGHPHIHVSVRAVGADGRRLAPGRAELREWREGFARELRGLGLHAEATQRQARGGAGRGEEARAAYLAIADALDRGGPPEDRRLAAEVRRFAEGLAAPPREPAGSARGEEEPARERSLTRR